MQWVPISLRSLNAFTKNMAWHGRGVRGTTLSWPNPISSPPAATDIVHWPHVTLQKRALLTMVLVGLAVLAQSGTVLGHPMEGSNAGFVQSVDGPAPGPFLYLGAKHMVTGYDHLLFLVGVVFFLYRLKDVVLYVSLFTLGHSLTLLVGVLGNVGVNAYVIDAIIGLSVVYKGFENVNGFERVFNTKPNTRAAVLVFGLFHGLGLATKLQEFTVADNGLVANILSFNVGVEIGQILALVGVVALLSYWRTRPSFLSYSLATNTALMAGGFLLAGMQVVGYVLFS